MTKPSPRQIEELNLLVQGGLGEMCPVQTAEAMARRGWVVIGDYDKDGYFLKITDKGRAALAVIYAEWGSDSSERDDTFFDT